MCHAPIPCVKRTMRRLLSRPEMSKSQWVRSAVKDEVRQQMCASSKCASPRTPGCTQMMSTERRVGMWKWLVQRVPPSNEADRSIAT